MITPNLATLVLAIAALILLVIIPLLDGSKRFAKFISLRYILTAVATIMALGCILDFSHLAESSRNIVLTGAMCLIGVFVIVRSLEKFKLGNKKIDLEVKKGDVVLKTKVENKPEPEDKSEKRLICENAILHEDDDNSADSECLSCESEKSSEDE